VSVAVRPRSVHFSLEKLHSRVIPTIFSTCDAVVVHGMVLRISDVAGRSDTPSRCFSLYPCTRSTLNAFLSFGSPFPRVYPIPGSRLVKATSALSTHKKSRSPMLIRWTQSHPLTGSSTQRAASTQSKTNTSFRRRSSRANQS
jgi:hypothetical protein